MPASASIAIVGGGPVGLFLSLKLAQKGHYVDLFEFRNWPIDKVCGQGITPKGIQLLNDLGIETSELGCTFDGIKFFDGDVILQGNFNTGVAKGIKRSDLSNALYLRCVNHPLINLINKKVDVFKNGKTVKVQTENFTKIYSYLFCCEGLNSQTRKKLKLEKKNVTSFLLGPRFGARFHYKVSPWRQMVEVYWNNGIECYVTPVNEHEVEIAFLWFEDQIKFKNLKENLINCFSEFLPFVSVDLISDFKVYGPFNNCSKKLKDGNIYFVGDAYCFQDGITGEGLSLGFMCATHLANHFKNFSLLNYLAIRIYYLKYTFFILLLLTLSKFPRIRKLVFRMFGFYFEKILNLSRL